MDNSTEQPGPAWQPLTARGIAAFAYASTTRLLLVQFLVACVVGGTVIWFLGSTCSPVIREVIRQLPETARLNDRELIGISAPVSAERPFLSLVADPGSAEDTGQTADVEIEFGKDRAKLCSILGCLIFRYPAVELSLARSAVEPWWGAWEPMLLAGAGLLSAAGLMGVWAMLGLIYSMPVRILAYYADRNLTFPGSWKLGSAALMPGALFMAVAIVLYGLQWIDLVRLLWLFAVHLVIGWVYGACAPFFLARLPTVLRLKRNPFSPRPKNK